MDRKLVDAINNLQEYHRFMKALLTWPGFEQKYIKFTRPDRKAGKTKYNYWKLASVALDGIFSFSVAPIRLILWVGLILAFTSFTYGGWLIYQKIFISIPLPGYTSLMVAILFLGGVQITALGVIGEYVGRIYNEAKARPIYVIDELLE